jgi:hypothetical protein
MAIGTNQCHITQHIGTHPDYIALDIIISQERHSNIIGRTGKVAKNNV